MKHLRLWPVAVAVGLLLTACGGGGDGDQSQRVSYGKLVSFGDSLSDVGSYATAGVKAMGGGRFTVNGTGNQIWVERLAAQAGLAAPCAAVTGLTSTGDAAALAQSRASHSGCYGYAQGGAMVTNPHGPGNSALGDETGALTEPVASQVANHLSASGDSFAASDLVTVLAGANDLFIALATYQATVAGGGNANTAATTAVTSMATAATQLATLITEQMIAKGAQRVVVAQVPDVSQTPMAVAKGTAAQGLILTLVQTFNNTLTSALKNKSQVLVVDSFAVNQDQIANPAQYELSNVKNKACTTKSSLLCSSATLVTGDSSRYLFADDVHPTPYGHKLLAQLVAIRMAQRGWL